MKPLIVLALFFLNQSVRAEVPEMKNYTFKIRRQGVSTTAVLSCSDSALEKLTEKSEWIQDTEPRHYSKKIMILKSPRLDMERFIQEALKEECILKDPHSN